jgi:hypothetical protein
VLWLWLREVKYCQQLELSHFIFAITLQFNNKITTKISKFEIGYSHVKKQPRPKSITVSELSDLNDDRYHTPSDSLDSIVKYGGLIFFSVVFLFLLFAYLNLCSTSDLMITTESVWYRSSFWSDSSDTVIDLQQRVYDIGHHSDPTVPKLYLVLIICNCKISKKYKT